jgi:hypothetical protein
MSPTAKMLMLVTNLAMLGASVGAASADTRWQRNHPWRVEVKGRLAVQNWRINRQVRDGDLTRSQAAALHRDDRAIRREERVMASLNHGHLTAAEHRALNQQENAVSRRIGY